MNVISALLIVAIIFALFAAANLPSPPRFNWLAGAVLFYLLWIALGGHTFASLRL